MPQAAPRLGAARVWQTRTTGLKRLAGARGRQPLAPNEPAGGPTDPAERAHPKPNATARTAVEEHAVGAKAPADHGPSRQAVGCRCAYRLGRGRRLPC